MHVEPSQRAHNHAKTGSVRRRCNLCFFVGDLLAIPYSQYRKGWLLPVLVCFVHKQLLLWCLADTNCLVSSQGKISKHAVILICKRSTALMSFHVHLPEPTRRESKAHPKLHDSLIVSLIRYIYFFCQLFPSISSTFIPPNATQCIGNTDHMSPTNAR